MRQEGWLRLSVGHEEEVKPDPDHRQQQQQTDPTATRDSFLELNLFSGGSNREEDQVGLPLSSLFQHQSGGGMMISPLMFPTRPEEMKVIIICFFDDAIDGTVLWSLQFSTAVYRE
ncbi:unnamed protein product [Arabis nemorensis]|uniref:Uncharacterized protein n=1 Tax=Arabis nemorensis TaxID=586526 RepID=A0A565CKV0_9BRAS|nr:unnamed protein product [Arabis nemorensis]